MKNSIICLPNLVNEPLLNYEPNSSERIGLLSQCEKLMNTVTEIPVVINGEKIKTKEYQDFTMPGNHSKKIYRLYGASPELLKKAIEGALEAKQKWEKLPWEHRVTIFLKAADLLSKKYRYKVNAATIIGQSKTIWQAEIDSAGETIDFWRFNAKYLEKIYKTQPPENSKFVWNKVEYRPLEGFVVALSPFNFTAIGANLTGMPVQMGNVVLWRPSRTAALSNYFIFKILEEAGVPKGVIQFVPTFSGAEFSKIVISHPQMSGIHFTGSTEVFESFYKIIGDNIKNYKTYPRIVGETGGKNFHLLHPTGDIDNFVHGTIRAAFEYSGQKCSACSRAYIPESLWGVIKEKFIKECKSIVCGKPNDPTSFLSSVIDKAAYERITSYIEKAKNSKECEIVVGGTFSDKEGWYIDPTIILTTNPHYETIETELFGPVLTVYVYKDSEFKGICKLVDTTSPYALTGAIFCCDRFIIEKTTKWLQNSAGNFYINDKSTGAVVGQQPFGGARKSGTNDKAGAEWCLLRWCSIRAIKESFLNLSHWSYPSVDLKN